MLFQSCYNRIDAQFEGLLSIVECSLLVGYTSGYIKRRMDENLLICKVFVFTSSHQRPFKKSRTVLP